MLFGDCYPKGKEVTGIIFPWAIVIGTINQDSKFYFDDKIVILSDFRGWVVL